MTAHTMNNEKKAFLELNLDKLDKVSGGWGSKNNPHEIYINGQLVDEATFNTSSLCKMSSTSSSV